VGATGISPYSRLGDHAFCLYNDQQVQSGKALFEAIRKAGSVPAVQINHGGRVINPKLSGDRLIAPSAIASPTSQNIPHELTIEEIEECGSADLASPCQLAELQTFVERTEQVRDAIADAAVASASFPGLFVRFAPLEGRAEDGVGSVRWWFYSVGLLLVFGVTFFGAYLLWRDVRREVQLAETRSRFVAAVSHELKTPLTAIRMFAETLHESESPDPDTQGEYLETIVNESERLTRLLNNVLDFSKIEGGRKTYHFESQPLEEIIRFSARAMRYPLEQKRFDLHLDLDDNVPPARVDRDAIEQAILNLLANAMKYSGESRDITLRLRPAEGEAVIEVSDQGVGIEPAELSLIFDRFYRVAGPENDRIPGAGLGLTLVQHIAEAHHGRVEVESQPGKGSTFSLFLPLNGAEA